MRNPTVFFVRRISLFVITKNTFYKFIIMFSSLILVYFCCYSINAAPTKYNSNTQPLPVSTHAQLVQVPDLRIKIAHRFHRQPPSPFIPVPAYGEKSITTHEELDSEAQAMRKAEEDGKLFTYEGQKEPFRTKFTPFAAYSNVDISQPLIIEEHAPVTEFPLELAKSDTNSPQQHEPMIRPLNLACKTTIQTKKCNWMTKLAQVWRSGNRDDAPDVPSLTTETSEDFLNRLKQSLLPRRGSTSSFSSESYNQDDDDFDAQYDIWVKTQEHEERKCLDFCLSVLSLHVGFAN